LYRCPLVICVVLVVLPCFGHRDLVNTFGWFSPCTTCAGWIIVVNIISHFSLLKKNHKNDSKSYYHWNINIFYRIISSSILYIKKTTSFSTFGLNFSFQKHPQFSMQIIISTLYRLFLLYVLSPAIHQTTTNHQTHRHPLPPSNPNPSSTM